MWFPTGGLSCFTVYSASAKHCTFCTDYTHFSYQVNCALSLNRSRSQWVDLGIHTEACMTRPQTCGAAGGAISVWINIADCSSGLCEVPAVSNGCGAWRALDVAKTVTHVP